MTNIFKGVSESWENLHSKVETLTIIFAIIGILATCGLLISLYKICTIFVTKKLYRCSSDSDISYSEESEEDDQLWK